MRETQICPLREYPETSSDLGVLHFGSPSSSPGSPVGQPLSLRQSVVATELGQLGHRSQQSTVRSNAPRFVNPGTETTSSPHRQYLDSLQPPSHQTFARLCSLQEDRERDHKRRNSELRRQEKVTARKSIEARREFMKGKVLGEEGKEGLKEAERDHHSPVFSRYIHQSSNSQSNSQECVGTTGDNGSSGITDRDGEHECLKVKAATVIQRSYRGYRVRREIQGLGLDASTRWTHAIRDAQWNELTKPRAREDVTLGTDTEGVNSDGTARSNARRNWIKVATIARRAGGDSDSDSDNSTLDDSSSLSSSSSEELARMDSAERDVARRKRQEAQARRRKHARMMGLQYFLEMIDLKHRHGSNLRTYHEEWKRFDTNENFFYWLDYGEGKAVDLATCPRERLDRECVRYLSREERQDYLVEIDLEGRLVWAKNGIRIDTTQEWKDSIHGIVPLDDPTPAFSPEIEGHMRDDARHHHHHHHPQDRSGSSSPSSRESELEAARAAKNANTEPDGAKGVGKPRHVSAAAAIFNKLPRKPARVNTWIFVADTAFRLYVEIKASGAFQHSSFLRGRRISAAGLIRARDGRLSRLSPLSGHYRPPAAHFRALVRSLEDRGADLSRVSTGRGHAMLAGLEAYVRARRKGKAALRRASLQTARVLRPAEARCAEEAARDRSRSAARERAVLERERLAAERRREETNVGLRLLRKIGVRQKTPAEPVDEGRASASAAGD
ncbi:putative IQ calmodulin-binding domain-containing protein [Rosellinia necatrix]|uniref:Putative IQ calmodulin-binding domain-containing protein n=1 Tax=Rosellinia necatrix TaxID=77044 RepID=A0A1W2TBR4_ROSNE|nr:putative IQ calmodulin-binding domain-containing protein [Rosellinia necatrix]